MPGVIPGMQAPACGPTSRRLLANAFRVGTDGHNAPIPAAAPTLPQPIFPGYNAVASGAGEALDPNFRPNVVDSFDLTIQRQLGNKFLLEMGYIGRRITHEYQPININSVPYMMTLGGQSFAKAYAAVENLIGCATSFALCGAATLQRHPPPAKPYTSMRFPPSRFLKPLWLALDFACLRRAFQAAPLPRLQRGFATGNFSVAKRLEPVERSRQWRV